MSNNSTIDANVLFSKFLGNNIESPNYLVFLSELKWFNYIKEEKSTKKTGIFIFKLKNGTNYSIYITSIQDYFYSRRLEETFDYFSKINDKNSSYVYIKKYDDKWNIINDNSFFVKKEKLDLIFEKINVL
jgi:hypothetical protein